MKTSHRHERELRPTPFRLRNSRHRVPRFVRLAGLASCLILASRVHAQNAALPLDDLNSGKLQPLDLKAGCWQVRTKTTIVAVPSPQTAPPQSQHPLDSVKLPSLDEMVRQMLANMTPEQRAQTSAEQLKKQLAPAFEESRKALAEAQKSAKASTEAMKKPVEAERSATDVLCSAVPFKDVGIEVYGADSPGRHCTHTVQEAGQVRRMHVEYIEQAGQGKQRDTVGDFERPDAVHFTGTQRQTAQAGQVTTAMVAKWIGENTAHMPYSPAPTDLDGKKPIGPHDVAWLDPNRIVAVSDGHELTAVEAYFLLNSVPYSGVDASAPGWSGRLQQIYMRRSVCVQAAALKGNAKYPDILAAFSAFATGSDDGAGMDKRVHNYHYIGKDMAEFKREESLWDSYFSQASTDAEKQALLRKLQAEYKIAVVDPDFFLGQPHPTNLN